MSERQDIFDFDDIDVFQEPIPQPYKSPIRQEPQSNQRIQPEQSQSKPSSKQNQPEQSQQKNTKQKAKKIANRFSLTDQQKINISKRLPKGFVLLKKGQAIQHLTPFKGQIEYVPIRKPPKIASEQLLEKFPLSVLSTMNPKKDIEKKIQKPGLRLSSGQLPQGKSKQTEKVKGVLLRFRKHPRYPQLAQQLNKLGLMQGFNEIESQMKKNIHTIDSFKNRCLYILNQAKLATPSESTTQVINELIDQFMFQIEQAKKLQFENNLFAIQKNIDKITRQITDIRQGGSWYLRRKKRTQKSFDQKEVMYIADLVKTLPAAYLVGVWEIIEERPFLQSQQKEIEINFSQLKTKKIREIQSYVKRKHNTYLTSRERKREKIRRKMEMEGVKEQQYFKKEQKQEQFVKNEQQNSLKQQNKQLQKINTSSVPKDELENFLSVEDFEKLQKDQFQTQPYQSKQMSSEHLKEVEIKKEKQEVFQINKERSGQKVMLVDDFLELDDMLMLQQNDAEDLVKMEGFNQSLPQDIKVPPTPRFSSLDMNPHSEEESAVKRQKFRLNSNEGQIEEEKQVEEFEMEQPDLRIPQRMDNESSDSSFITDDQDSDY